MTGKIKSKRRSSKSKKSRDSEHEDEVAEEVTSDVSKESSGEEIDTNCLVFPKEPLVEEKSVEDKADSAKPESSETTEACDDSKSKEDESGAEKEEEAVANDDESKQTAEESDAPVEGEDTAVESSKPDDASADGGDDESKDEKVCQIKASSEAEKDGAAVTDESEAKNEATDNCEIALDLSEDEAMDITPVKELSEEEKAERARRRALLQEMEEKKIDFDDDTVEIEADPEFDTEDEVVVEKENFKRYWKTVVEMPQDFNAWIYILQLVEQEGQIALTRRAYNSFFQRYPLCYGYWKKFSEVERKKNNINRARKILERGVRAIRLSVDLWMHVTDFYIKYYEGPDAGVQKIRTVFKRALKAAGEEFRSEKLWKKYINYELENKRFSSVLEVYDQVLSIPTQYYQNFFLEFSEFVNSHNPADLLKEAEFEKALTKAREELVAAESKKKDAEEDEEDLDEAPPGLEDHEKPPNDEELKHIRQQIINQRKEVYDVTEKAATAIWNFEEGIKRPYFHVKKLERAQLKNWHEYLDAEIAREDHHRTVLLFERCLIACALYEDFWLKYAKYMAEHDAEEARAIYKRACRIHLPKQPNVHVQWAAFEEVNGCLDAAALILEKLDGTLQGMATIKMRRVAVARRAGKMNDAEAFLREYVASAGKEKEELFYTRKLAWFLYKLADGKQAEARELLKKLIEKYSGEVKLYSDLIEMEFHSAGLSSTLDDEKLAMEAFDIALDSAALTDEQKFSFSQKKLEFLEDFGHDVKRLQKAYDEHQKLRKSQKKRQAEQQAAAAAEQPPSKKSKTDVNGGGQTSPVASSTLPNGGSRYTAASYSSTAAPSTQPTAAAVAAAYSSADPAAASYYSQNYWNYHQQQQQNKAADPSQQQQQYNYQQWGQYYGAR